MSIWNVVLLLFVIVESILEDKNVDTTENQIPALHEVV